MIAVLCLAYVCTLAVHSVLLTVIINKIETEDKQTLSEKEANELNSRA